MNKIKFHSPRVSNGVNVIDVEFTDKFAIEDPIMRKSVTDEIVNVLIPAIEAHKRKLGTAYRSRSENPITNDFFAQSKVIQRWQKTMPTAAALYPLQRPEKNKLADGTPFDDVARRYFPHALDGEGLRSRAAIMQKIMVDHFKNSGNKAELITWASLACGAAIPVFDAAKELMNFDKNISILLADIDRSALEFAKRLAEEEYGLSDSITIRKMNILKLDKLKSRFGEQAFDAIDILGFFEYLPSSSWQYRKFKVRRTMPGAVEFLGTAYSLLKPGGVLVLGNMRDTHSQLTFTTDIVRWPYIRPRSMEKVTHIIEEAGVSKEQITYFQAGDGVYTVAAITK